MVVILFGRISEYIEMTIFILNKQRVDSVFLLYDALFKRKTYLTTIVEQANRPVCTEFYATEQITSFDQWIQKENFLRRAFSSYFIQISKVR
jgi:hypothetical protein